MGKCKGLCFEDRPTIPKLRKNRHAKEIINLYKQAITKIRDEIERPMNNNFTYAPRQQSQKKIGEKKNGNVKMPVKKKS